MSQAGVTVVVTSYEDERVEQTLSSLAGQRREPDEVILADGSRDEAFVSWLTGLAEDHDARVVHEEGASVARARNRALEAASGGIVAFLDTDQWAPDPWLGRLVRPLEEGSLDWTGGPTRPLAPMDLVALKEARLYEAAREDPTRIPMGNSAWTMHVFDEVGPFDERLSMGGEDWDLALRAKQAGFEGGLVADAWVEHDLTGLDSYRTVAKKQFQYNVGGGMAYLKNRSLAKRASMDLPRVERHWFDLVEPVLKIAALPVAWWRLRQSSEDADG